VRTHKSNLIGAGLTNVRCAPVATKFRAMRHWQKLVKLGQQ
jgi:hypothetical protein